MLTHKGPARGLTKNARNAYFQKFICTAQICSTKDVFCVVLTATWAGGARQWCQLATCWRSELTLSVQRDISLFVTGWNQIWGSHTFIITRHAEPCLYFRLHLMKYSSWLQFGTLDEVRVLRSTLIGLCVTSVAASIRDEVRPDGYKCHSVDAMRTQGVTLLGRKMTVLIWSFMYTYTTCDFSGSQFPCEEIIERRTGWRVHVVIRNDDIRSKITLHYTCQ
jgi:hypothetical protein